MEIVDTDFLVWYLPQDVTWFELFEAVYCFSPVTFMELGNDSIGQI